MKITHFFGLLYYALLFLFYISNIMDMLVLPLLLLILNYLIMFILIILLFKNVSYKYISGWIFLGTLLLGFIFILTASKSLISNLIHNLNLLLGLIITIPTLTDYKNICSTSTQKSLAQNAKHQKENLSIKK